MGLVGNTYNVAAVREETCLFTEFLDCGDVDASARLIPQRFLHVFTALYAANIALMQILLCGNKQLRSLRVQILTVLQNYNRGIVKGIVIPECNQPRKEQHRIGFAAAGSSKVCTAFAITFRTHMFPDAVKHLVGTEELRIAAYNGLILFAVIRIENEVSKNL